MFTASAAPSVSSFLQTVCKLVVLGWVALSIAACSSLVGSGSTRHLQPLSQSMLTAIRNIGSTPGDAIFMRIFKQEAQLEVWKRTASGQFRLLKTYEICTFSGDLGPKFREGDRQSPEGIYTIVPGLMNPNSNYHLAFNTGFPNKFDRVHGRTGSNLMVHGDCSSVGCYAMTDSGISEIYALARESFAGGNTSFQLQIFPFRMTPANIAQNASNQHAPFWQNIKEAYDYFEVTRTPPTWDVCEQRYVFGINTGTPLDPMGVCPPITRSAALTQRMQDDQAAVERLLTAEARQQREAEVIAARGEAINNSVSGFFSGFGSLLGGGQEAVAPVMTRQPAPAPMAPIQRN